MKTKLIILLTFLCSIINAQISDFTTDSCAFTQSLQVYHRYITVQDSIDAQAEEFGYTSGDNELIIFDLRTINMGADDAGIVNALDTTGIYWSEYHYHYHLDGWNRIYLLDTCKNLIEQDAGKVGFNLQDGMNIMSYLQSSNGACLNTWLNEYGTPDYSLTNHSPNPDFNGDTRMGLSAGYADDYGRLFWGNSKRINNILNGKYYLRCAGSFSRYFNQGNNLFPDSFDVPIEITGVYPNRTVNVTNIGQCVSCNSDTIPFAITAITGRGNFGTREVILQGIAATETCPFQVERLLVQGNQFQVSAVLTVNSSEFMDYTAAPGYFYRYRKGSVISNKVKYK